MKIAINLRNLCRYRHFYSLRKLHFSSCMFSFYKFRLNRYSVTDNSNSDSSFNDRKPSEMKEAQEESPSQENKLFIRNLPYNTVKEEMYELFSSYGEIEDVHIPWDRTNNMPRTICFVRFKNPEVAKSLVEMGTLKYKNRAIVIAPSLPSSSTRKTSPETQNPNNDDNESKIIVKNLPFDTEQAELKELFSVYGPCNINLPRSLVNPEQNRGFAFIKFDTKEACEKALSQSGYELNGRKIFVSLANAPNANVQRIQLMIKNLDYSTTKEELAQFLEENGIKEIENIRVPVGQNSPCRGFGFVSLKNKDSSDRLMSLSGSVFKERKISVIVAENRERTSMSQRQTGAANPNRNRYESNEDLEF